MACSLKHTHGQLGLGLSGHEAAMGIECRGVFSTLYLRPVAQEQLIATPESCLAVIERPVNWKAEKPCGVEGLGPFDEF